MKNYSKMPNKRREDMIKLAHELINKLECALNKLAQDLRKQRVNQENQKISKVVATPEKLKLADEILIEQFVAEEMKLYQLMKFDLQASL